MINFNLENFTALLMITCGPALTSIIGCIISFIKTKINNKNNKEELINKFAEVENAIKDRKEYTELKEQYKIALQANRELMEANAKLLTEMTKIAIKTGVENEKESK